MSTYPNARRDYAGPPNGKPGKARLDFPTQSLDDQSIIEDVPFRVDDPSFQLTPYLTPHPKAPAYILVKQFPFLGNDNAVYVRMIFRKSVGVPLAGSSVGGDWRLQFAAGGVTTTTTQRRPYGDDPEDGDDVVSGSAQPLDAVDSQSTTVTAPDGFTPLTGYDYGADQWRRFAKDGSVSVTRTLVDKGAAPDAGALVISSRVEAMSDAAKNSAIKTTWTASELVSLTSVNAIDGSAMGAVSTTVETPVATGTALPSVDWKTLEATHQALNPKQALQTVRTVSAYPVLYGTKFDQRTGGLISLEKTFVANGTPGSYNSATGEIVEVQEHDRLKSIQIKSKLISYPSSRQIPIKYNFSFPDELLDAEFKGIWAAANGKLAYDVSLKMDLRRGYRGPCDAVLHEVFTTNPAGTSIPSITKFFPQGHRILGAWTGILNDNPLAQIRDFIIPESLHPYIDPTPLTPPSGIDDVFFSDIPATSPTAVPWGTEICVEVPDREPWRGIQIVRYIMLTCPSLT